MNNVASDNGRGLVELILNAGSIAGLVTIFLEVHQSRRHRPSFTYTFEGTHAEVFHRDGRDWADFHFLGIIRNASLQANSIVRLYLVVWKEGKVTQTLRFGHVVNSITDLATNDPLALPLHMEARSAMRVEVVFGMHLTEGDGRLSNDGRLMSETVPVPSTIPGLAAPKHTFEFVFEDAAGNYFDKTGHLLSRELIDLNWTLVNYKGWKRFRRYGTIAWAWVRWKLAVARSYLGFYK